MSSRRPIRHRAAVLQSVRGERGREGGEGVPHCRYESKWWRQEQRRIIAVAHSATLHGQNSRTSHTARSERESEGGNQTQQISCDCTFPLYCCYYYYFISIAGILSVAFRRGNSTTSQSVLRLRIQEGSITWRSRMQLCKNTNTRGFLLHGL